VQRNLAKVVEEFWTGRSKVGEVVERSTLRAKTMRRRKSGRRRKRRREPKYGVPLEKSFLLEKRFDRDSNQLIVSVSRVRHV